jgi:hypothetical protein
MRTGGKEMSDKKSNTKGTKKSPSKFVPFNNLPTFTTTNTKNNTLITTIQSNQLDEIEGRYTPQYDITTNISSNINELLVSNLHLVDTWDTSPVMPYAIDVCDEGLVLVSGLSTNIMVFSLTGINQDEWTIPTIEDIPAGGIRGLAVDKRMPDGRIYVAMASTNWIHVLNRDGTLYTSWQGIVPGGDYLGPSGIISPHGFSVLPNGNLIIADDRSHSLHFFTPNGLLIKTIGSKGNNLGQLFNPRQLAYDDRNGDIYVVDRNNHRIQVLDVFGNCRRQWGELGSSVEQFNSPHGIALDKSKNIIYVSDTINNRIQVFKTDGSFLKVWSAADFQQPRYMAFSSDNRLYVTSVVNKKVGIFEFRP